MDRSADVIVETLGDALFSAIRPDFLYVSLANRWESRSITVVQTDQWRDRGHRARAIGRSLNSWLNHPERTQPIPNPVGAGSVRLAVTPIGQAEAYGMIVAGHQRADFPSERDRLVLRLAANEAAVALHGTHIAAERASHLAREQAARDEAERAWAVTEFERRRLEDLVEENTRLLEQASGKAALEERQRLARELHDSVSQALYGIALTSSAAIALRKTDPARLEGFLNEVLALAEDGLAEMRSLIFELRPESLEQEGLVAALEKQVAATHARHGLDIHCSFCAEPTVPLPVKEALYRIAQQALENIGKHARAGRSELTLDADEHTLTLSVSDNGKGFDANRSYPGHLGLQSMRERAEAVRGTLEVNSVLEKGTAIIATIPVGGKS